MKLIIPTKHLHNALLTLKPIASKGKSLPILGNILFETGEQCVKLTATDTDQRLSITVPCAVNKPGSTSQHAIRITSIIGGYRGSETVVETNAKHVTRFSSGQAHHTLPGLDPSEFPAAFAIDFADSIQVDGMELKRLLGYAHRHASIDQTRAMFRSVTMRSREGFMSIESSDSKRVFTALTTWEFSRGGISIVPMESVAALSQFEVGCQLSFSENVLSAKSPTMEFATKLIEGTLPDFKSVIPAKDFTTALGSFHREELIAIIESASQTTDEMTPGVILACDGDTMTVSGKAKDIGEGVASIKALSEAGKFEVCVMPDYLIDALKVLDAETATIEVTPGRGIGLQESNLSIFMSAMRIS